MTIIHVTYEIDGEIRTVAMDVGVVHNTFEAMQRALKNMSGCISKHILKMEVIAE